MSKALWGLLIAWAFVGGDRVLTASSWVVVGSFLGDEGKGAVCDFLAQEADYVVRFNGGNNAGHTVMQRDKTYTLHMLPSGVINPSVVNVIGAGCVVNVAALGEEIAEVEAQLGRPILPHQLVIDMRAGLICSFHLELDRAQEDSAKQNNIGTTRKGIGPGYVDLSSRLGLRCGDLLEDQGTLTNKVRKVVAWHNVWRKHYGLTPLSVAGVVQELNTLRPLMARYGQDGVSQRLTTACAQGKKILLEGAQGLLLDLTWGHAPFVTSCSTGVAAASLGTGVPPHALRHVWAVAKAYATRVGEGPFLTEMLEEDGRTTKLHQLIREKGGEYGATTDRPRRIGYLDLVALKETVQRHGVGGLVLTKIDVLDGVDKIPMCVGYRDPDTHHMVTYIPASLAAYKRLKPVYKTLNGWRTPTGNLQSFDALPPEAQAFVKFIEDFCGQKVCMIKTGPTREACMMITHPWKQDKDKIMS